jgi:hypothetical protein
MKLMKTCFSSVLSAGFLCAGLILGVNTYAAGTSPCAEDISKFCPNAKPGDGNIMECLEKHENELTDACRMHEAKIHNKRSERKEIVQEQIKFRQACRNDMSKFCGNAKPGSGEIVKCLNVHEKDLSSPCSYSLKSIESTRE